MKNEQVKNLILLISISILKYVSDFANIICVYFKFIPLSTIEPHVQGYE